MARACSSSAAPPSTTRRACRVRASRSTTPTWWPPVAAAPPSGWPRRSRSQPSERARLREIAESVVKRRSSTAAAVLATAAALLFCAGGCAGTVHSRAPARSSQPAPALDVSGCARGVGPCGRYAGIRDELAAIASQQRAAGGAGFQVVVVILGAPSWAALAASGCEPAGTAAFSRPLRPTALVDYRGLISSLLTLAAAEGVPLRWWSPWNEPNDPRFISPQQASCAAAGQPVSAGVYAQLARAMAAALRAGGGVHDMLLGELGDIQRDSPHATSVASFVAALPADVLCLAAAWSIHAYASRHAGAPADAVQALEGALDSRCL